MVPPTYLAFTIYNLAVIAAGYDLAVFHTNDVHARFEETDEFGGKCSPGAQCFGGVARRMTKLRELRKEHPNNVFVDGGDQFQGTLWFFVHKGSAAAHFMNLLRYDAQSIGNHEFDNGPSGYAPFLKNITFPVVSCNADASDEPELVGLWKKSVVLQRGAKKIGIIGYITSETPQLSRTGQVKFTPVVECIRAEAKRLKAEGVHIIIAIGHAGFATDREIAKNVDEVSIVVGGHTNTFLYTGKPPSIDIPSGSYPTVVTSPSGRKALVVQDFAFGKYLGFLNVKFNDASNLVESWTGNPILLDSSVEQDTAVLSQIADWRQAVSEADREIVSRTLVTLDGRRTSCRLKECNLGNLVADSMVQQNLKPTKDSWSRVGLALVNGGSIRSGIQRGNISIGDINSVMPFRNTIDKVTLLGRDIRSIFETSVELYDPIEQHGRFLQVSGFRVVYDLTREPGARVVSVKVRCTNCTIPAYEALRDDAHYAIITSSFLAKGGDGFDVIRTKRVAYENMELLDVDIFRSTLEGISDVTIGEEERIMFAASSSEVNASNSFKCCHIVIVLLSCVLSTLYIL